MKHIKLDYKIEILGLTPWVDLGGVGGQKVKIQLFQNMVMLHIKIKGITIAATW